MRTVFMIAFSFLAACNGEAESETIVIPEQIVIPEMVDEPEPAPNEVVKEAEDVCPSNPVDEFVMADIAEQLWGLDKAPPGFLLWERDGDYIRMVYRDHKGGTRYTLRAYNPHAFGGASYIEIWERPDGSAGFETMAANWVDEGWTGCLNWSSGLSGSGKLEFVMFDHEPFLSDENIDRHPQYQQHHIRAISLLHRRLN